ncbi:MAG TPA: hypothetical protein VHX88_06085 [Solirubrobacteraceae bacterium]|nr:hypothetical protein [Solirubrobacteraceae bacterium]
MRIVASTGTAHKTQSGTFSGGVFSLLQPRAGDAADQRRGLAERVPGGQGARVAILVDDFRRHRQILVHAGQRYLAKAP